MSKHTPGPWGIIAIAPKAATAGHTAYIIGRRESNIEKSMTGLANALSDDNAVCIVAEVGNGIGDANAALIIKAVNCHDDLVGALQAVVDADNCKAGMGTVYEMSRAISEVNAALAKAKGDA